MGVGIAAGVDVDGFEPIGDKTVYINTGCNSDALRGASCNPYMFHIEGANSMYVMAGGQYVRRQQLVRGDQRHTQAPDYAFGPGLPRGREQIPGANGRPTVAGTMGSHPPPDPCPP